MADEDTAGSPAEPDEPSDPLRWWERVGALVLGLASLTSGVLAVFRTENQAGSAALLLIAAVLILVAIQGTPILSLGDGSSSVRLDRRKNARRLLATASEVAETNPDVARGLAAGAAIVAPGLPEIAHTENSIYARQVLAALKRAQRNISESGTASVTHAGDSGSDVELFVSGRRIVADVRHLQVGYGLPSRYFDRLGHLLTRGTSQGFLLVLNINLPAVQRGQFEQLKSRGHNIEVVTWNTAEDDDPALLEALQNLASG